MKIMVKGHLTAHANYKKGFRAALQEDQEHDNWEKITESKHETARVYNASLPFFCVGFLPQLSMCGFIGRLMYYVHKGLTAPHNYLHSTVYKSICGLGGARPWERQESEVVSRHRLETACEQHSPAELCFQCLGRALHIDWDFMVFAPEWQGQQL